MGLILDSSVAITAERQGMTAREMLDKIYLGSADRTMALSSVGLTELVHGIYRAQTPHRQQIRQSFVDDLLQNLPVYSYTKETAMLAGRIDGQQQAQGITIPFPDLLIGATALSAGFSIVTSNLRHFRLIPGLFVTHFETSR